MTLRFKNEFPDGFDIQTQHQRPLSAAWCRNQSYNWGAWQWAVRADRCAGVPPPPDAGLQQGVLAQFGLCFTVGV